jgi:hypothetical protein
VADQYPNAEVLGIDLSPIQPTYIPENVRFMVDDCEDDWANGPDWDLVHFRQMAAHLGDVDRCIYQAFQ